MTAAFEWLNQNAITAALVWMLFANLMAFGPRWMTIVALTIMLLTAPLILFAVFTHSSVMIGWLLAPLMLFQLRWTLYFLKRLFRSLRGSDA